jgi:3',5'-nucleoside bisphosphate phosphatase
MTVDLQIHTVATPHHATWTPEALAEAAAAAGLQVVAVTDHNTMASVHAAQAAGARQGLQVIAGVEIDSGFAAGGQSGAPTKLWHTLVYGAPPDDPALLALCEAVFARNQADATALQAELARRGFQIAGLDVLGRPPNVADVGAALARQNQLPGRQAGDDDESAGMRYIIEQVPGGYRPVGVDEVIAVAHQAGGLAVLAHPGRSKGVYAIPATAEDIAAMAAAGLDGIEVFYPSHSAEQRAFYHELAQRHGLLITGGSDSHGPQQALAAWPLESCKMFLDRIL